MAVVMEGEVFVCGRGVDEGGVGGEEVAGQAWGVGCEEGADGCEFGMNLCWGGNISASWGTDQWVEVEEG